MIVTRFGVCLCTFLCLVLVQSDTINIPTQLVSESLVQGALKFLNAKSNPQRVYKGGNLISAQRLVEQPNTIYRLTLDLELICEDAAKTCPHEACAIDVEQLEHEAVDVKADSIQCMYLYPQVTLTENQDNSEQAVIENLEKQIVNQSVQLDHEVQNTADQNDRPFIAVRASSTHYCPGCPYELKPTLPGLVAFGEDIVNSMDEYGMSDFKHKVVEIIRVVRLVPPGSTVIRYELLLEIGESNCLRSSLIERSKCALQLNAPIKLCFVTIDERPWQQPKNRQIVKNNCTESTDMVNELNVSNFEESSIDDEDDTQKITKPETYEYDQLAQEGKISTYASFADPQFSEPSVGSVEEKTDTTVPGCSEGEPVAVPVSEEPFVQVVLSREPDEKPPKFVDKYREFDEFLKDFDIPIKETSTSTPDDRTPVVEEEIRPVKIPLADSITTVESAEKTQDISVSRTKRQLIGLSKEERIIIRKVAQRVVEILDDLDSDNHKRIVLDVLEAKKETDDEVVYHLTIKVGSTHCAEKEALDRSCMASLIGPARICEVQAQIDPGRPLGKPKIKSSQCYDEGDKENVRNKRENLVGAPSHVDVNDPTIQQYASLGFQKFTENFEGSNEPILIQVTEATKQVVSGMLYKIKVRVGTSNCPKGVKENCQLRQDSEVKECLITVWSQPWLDKGSPRITVNCNANERQKRSLRGVNYSQKMLQQAKELKEERMFNEFQQLHQKQYKSEEEKQYRFKIFRENLKRIKILQETEQGTARYGLTYFADLTQEEFRKYTGLKFKPETENMIPLPKAEIPDIELPKEFDWRHYNVVTPVKNQGQCGSCWAFSVTGNVEGQYAIKHGKLLSLSEQELVDCDKFDDGCEGGLQTTAYEAIEELGGLELEKDYPYEAEDEKCHFKESLAKVQVASAVNITQNETQMAQWLVQNGPIAIAINANAMQFYFGGISHPLKFLCSPKDLDHGVLIVGYGVHTYKLFNRTLPYWIIKNSWGPRWGEQGYYRVYRGGGTCGLNQNPTSAVVN